MTDPRTGLPKTLDPHLIKGEDRQGYQVAKEIPEILAQGGKCRLKEELSLHR